MKNKNRIKLLSFFFCMTSCFAWGGEMKVKLKGLSTDQDTSILIQKGIPAETTESPHFEIISESDEIIGEPRLSLADSKASWEAACEKWEQKIREMHKSHQLIALKCGLSSVSRDANGSRTHQSTGSYKVRMRTRDIPVQEVPSKKLETPPQETPSQDPVQTPSPNPSQSPEMKNTESSVDG
jgi:hypothetical protein